MCPDDWDTLEYQEIQRLAQGHWLCSKSLRKEGRFLSVTGGHTGHVCRGIKLGKANALALEVRIQIGLMEPMDKEQYSSCGSCQIPLWWQR